MDKENKLIPEQEAKENEIVELKDEELEVITASKGGYDGRIEQCEEAGIYGLDCLRDVTIH